MSNTPPFKLDLELSIDPIDTLELTVCSQKANEDSIEIADEFFREIFIPAINQQLFNDGESLSDHAIQLLSTGFESESQSCVYQFKASYIPTSAYPVLISLFAQAVQLEEPIEKISLRSTSAHKVNFELENLIETWEQSPIPSPLPIPMELDWEYFNASSNGCLVNITFQTPPKEEAIQKFEEALIVWNNLYFTHAFNFDFNQQEVHFPAPGDFARISPVLFTYTVPPLESAVIENYEHALIPLFNIMRYGHYHWAKLGDVLIEG